jgi:Rab proteins geranylgeranyltransferase component A
VLLQVSFSLHYDGVHEYTIFIHYRLCAVFGGIYCLSRKIDSLHFAEPPENEFNGLQWGEQRINGKHIIFGPHSAINPADLFTSSTSAPESPAQKVNSCGELSRAIFITATPLGGFSQNTGGGGVAFMKLPPINGMKHKGVHVFQLSHYSGTCPKGLCKY